MANDPRVTSYQGTQVYAARCWYCGDDRHTEHEDTVSILRAVLNKVAEVGA